MQGEADDSQRVRVLLVDDHEVSRVACRALLRTEGLEVVADVSASGHALDVAEALRPDVAIVDIGPGDPYALDLALRLQALPSPPMVTLTSSTERSAFGGGLDGFGFVPKADICAEQIRRLLRAETHG